MNDDAQVWAIAAVSLRPVATPEVWFEDGTQASGIDFRHRHGGSGRRYMVETMGSGGGLGDLDGDGDGDGRAAAEPARRG